MYGVYMGSLRLENISASRCVYILGICISVLGWVLLSSVMVMDETSCMMLSAGLDCAGNAEWLAAHDVGPNDILFVATVILITGPVISILAAFVGSDRKCN